MIDKSIKFGVLNLLTFMGKLSAIGRCFYGIAIAAMGLLTMYFKDFPYMLIPPNHHWLNEHVIFLYLSGALLILAGGCIVLSRMIVPISLVLGTVLLLIFCFYFIPYEVIVSANYKQLGDWENAAKELALAGGAFVVAGRGSKRLFLFGTLVFSLTILIFGINHFVYAKEAAGYISSWIPYPLFWMYFCGLALVGSAIGIILKIKPRLMAMLLGMMIFSWVIILHIPKSIAAGGSDMGGEISSGFLALAYCGIAFVIAGENQP